MRKQLLVIGALAGIVSIAPAAYADGNGRNGALKRVGDGLTASTATLRDRLGNDRVLIARVDGDALREVADNARDRREERRENRQDRLDDRRDAINDRVDDLRDAVADRLDDGDRLIVVRTSANGSAADGSLSTALRSGLLTTVSLQDN